MFFVMEIVPS